MQKRLSLLFSLGFCTVANSLLASSLKAQVAPDGTTNTTVNSGDGNNFTIEQGDRAGANLFHSFQSFSVPNNGSAVFNNAAAIENIFSRVTGGNISNINGLIQANDANLFLINPAGIVFGANSRLDIGGSFLGTTADSILFEDGEFSATDFDNPPLLTVNAPIGLNFRDNPGDIINRSVDVNPNQTNATGGSVGLQVSNGSTLALAGGNLLLDDGNLTAQGGNLELGAVRQGNVAIDLTDSIIALNYAGVDLFGAITLENTAVIDVSATEGGNINLNGVNITVDNSTINAGIFPGLGNVEAQAGDVFINARDSLTVLQNARISNSVGDSNTLGTMGDSGNIIIETLNLTVTNSAISNSLFGLGNSGNVIVNASNLVSLNGERPNTRNGNGSPGGILAQVDLSGEGNAGNLTIETKTLSISDGAKAQVATFGDGDAGNLNITAETIEIFNTPVFSNFTTGIFADVATDPLTENPSEGSAGNINIETQTLALKDGGMITSSTEGIGNAGNVQVQATESIEISGIDPDGDGASILGAEVKSGAVGSAGNVTIETNELNVIDAGQISVSTFGEGNAGNLSVFANDLEIDGGENNLFGGIFGQVLADATGEGGNIIFGNEQSPIKTLNINNGATISLNSFGGGNAGNLLINLAESMSINNGSSINLNTFGQGNAGSLTINAEEANISVDGFSQSENIPFAPSGIFSTVNSFVDENGEVFTGVGQGGNVTISAKSLIIRNFAVINTGTFAEGNAGNINIETSNLNLENSGTIRSNVEQGGLGNAGDINLQSQNLNISSGGQIGTTVQRASFDTPGGSGNGGDITINVIDSINISGIGLEQLPIIDFSNDPENNTGLIPTANFSSGLIANTQADANGDAGNIFVTTNSLNVADGGIINSTTSNEGLGGNIVVNAATLNLAGGGQILTTSIDSSGNAGNIQLNLSDSINISGFDPNFVDRLARANEFGSTQGGQVIVENQGAESGIFANTSANSTGNGGSIEIGIFKLEEEKLVLDNTSFTSNVSLLNRGTISSDSNGEGNGGSITVRSANLNLNNQAQILAETNFGEGGNIFLNLADNLSLRDSSLISAQAFGGANGGNLTIDTNFIIAFPDGNNDIIANAQQGQGGSIAIDAESLLGIQERPLNDSTNDINASSDLDLDGTVSIFTPDINPVQGATELPNNLVVPGKTVAQACASQTANSNNNFIVKGRGGVPNLPTAALGSEIININGKSINNSANSAYAIPTSQGNIIPARGVIKAANGQIILTATPVQNGVSRVVSNSANCS